MQLRRLGKTGIVVSALGFGMMRLPVLSTGKVDEEKTFEMVRYAVEEGVNYFDTAYPYHDGESEVVLGKSLKGGLREKVYIATKCPSWMVQKPSDYDRFLDIQLERLGTDCIDMYLMHRINRDCWSKVKETGFQKFLERAKSDGRIKYTGFSFHDTLSLFKEAVDEYPWDFCQIQYNYLDEDYQAGTEGLHYAYEKGLGVVVMEPLRGGRLAERGSREISDLWGSKNPAEWGLRWVWNHPEVSTALSGMGEFSQVVENIETAKTAYPNSLTREEIKTIENVRDVYHDRLGVLCTGCKYCIPCPQGINIPEWFDAYNRVCLFDRLGDLVEKYPRYTEEHGGIDSCVSCGLCEDQCPQDLSIRQKLQEIKRVALGGSR